MKTKQTVFIATLCLLLFITLSLAHGQWEKHAIGVGNGPACVFAADINNDGKMDVAATIQDEKKVVWFENIQSGWTEHTIDDNLDGAYTVIVTDINGNDTLDVVAVGLYADDVVWYENNDLSWTKHTIDGNLDGAQNAFAVDLDADGDIDVLAVGFHANDVGWYENDLPTWTKHTIDDNVDGAANVFAADIDNNDTLDVVVTAYRADDVLWYKNNHPVWTKHTIDANLNGAFGLHVIDIDGDNSMDVVASGRFADDVVWYENNLPSWIKHTIDSNIDGVWEIFAAYNGDSPDVFAAGSDADDIIWYENDNLTWTKHIVDGNLNGATDVYVTNIGGNDNPDIVATGWYQNAVLWYENMAPVTINVPDDQPTIQAGIDAASDGDVVLVAEGSYYENINFKGKAITVASHFFLDGDSTHISNTIINGSQPSDPDNGSVVSLVTGEDTTSVLCGFTITGGKGTATQIPGHHPERDGGGVFIKKSGGIITDNHIINNLIITGGDTMAGAGGIFIWCENGDKVIVRNNLIQNNNVVTSYWSFGGAALIWSKGEIIFEKNRIIANKVNGYNSGWAGGIFVDGIDGYVGESVIRGNLFKNNEAFATESSGELGGAIYIRNVSPRLSNNIFAGNTAQYGGGICVDKWSTISGDARPFIFNNTFSENIAEYGGAIVSYGSGAVVTIINTIIWGNVANMDNNELSVLNKGVVSVSYSDIKGGWSGSGNIDADPLLYDIVHADGDTLYCCLQEISPCIDTGNPDPQYNDLNGSRNDMGAYGGPTPIDVTYIDEVRDRQIIPRIYCLSQNYPNPFNPSTTIKFQIPNSEFTTLKVYDILGREVSTLVSKKLNQGNHTYTFDGKNLASGVYMYRLVTKSGFSATKKFILLK